MPQRAQDAYLESRITSAAPLELVRLLYQGASATVREARQCLAGGDIRGRSRAISKAFAILAELARALDRTRGGEIADRLAKLYDYMGRRLLEANCRQADEPLAEVLGLLATLGEAWEGAAAELQRPEPAYSESSAVWQAAEPETSAAAGRVWSF